MVVLTAIVKVVEGKGDSIEKDFKKLVPTVLKDPGVITYTVYRAVDDPNKFLVYEQYENQEAFKYHGQTEHFKSHRQATKNMLVGEPEITFYNKIA